MNDFLSLYELNVNQKDALILFLWEENQACKPYILKLEEQIKELKQEVAKLRAENDDLRSRLNKNSRNSHQPSSRDGFKRPKSLRAKSDKPSGGQIGHRGHTLKESDHPDRQIRHDVKRCPHCFYSLENVNSLDWKKAQVFDIAPLKIEVEEHLVEEKLCPHCQRLCQASLPSGIRFGTQYGNRLRALSVYLHNYQYLSSNRVSEFFQDLFNHTLSEGTLFNAEKTCFTNLEPFRRLLKVSLINCSLAYADETGLRCKGENYYLHVFSTSKASAFYIHPKRGREAMENMGILPSFKGTLVHDHYLSYFKYGMDHALCNAHHLRELQNVFESTGHSWAIKMQNLLKKIKKEKDLSRLCHQSLQEFTKEYDEILYLGYDQQKERSPPIPSHPKEISLLDRLKHYKTQTLLFMYKEEVPFDNNQAERDIRMMKLKMKISGCFRDPKWTFIFCSIRSFISTVRKNGMAIFQSLIDAMNGLSPAFLSSLQFS